MILKDERGSTLMESVISMFVLSIMTALIVSTFLAGLSLYTKSFQEYSRVNDVYSDIELIDEVRDSSGNITSSTVGSGDLSIQEGSISFDYGGGTIEIDGTYIYDTDSEKLGEFVVE